MRCIRVEVARRKQAVEHGGWSGSPSMGSRTSTGSRTARGWEAGSPKTASGGMRSFPSPLRSDPHSHRCGDLNRRYREIVPHGHGTNAKSRSRSQDL
jgi:hypothetical protein